jgi:LCP family protein required for cell wall assembly
MANPFGKKPPIRDAQHYPNLFRSVRTRRNRFWGRWYGWVAIGLAAVLVFGGGFGLWYYYSFQAAITDEVSGTNKPDEGDPTNVLIVGSDSREGLTEEQKVRLGAADVGGERADTLIVAHIDPATDRVTMVQFPRDYYVSYPDGRQERINAALQEGDGFLIKTVEHVTGIDINDYVKVDIAGFRKLVDAIGGVRICMTEAVPFDSATGIEITEDEVPGMVFFDGDRAISYVRSRKVFTEGDFARIQNQQRFLAAAIRKTMSAGTLFRIDRLLELKSAVGQNIKVSDTLNLGQIRDLAKQLSNVNPDTYEVYTAPHFGTMTTSGGASVVEPDLESMKYLFQKIKNNESPSEDGVPDIPPSDIVLGVYNGTGVDGAASTAADELVQATVTEEGEELAIKELADADRDDYGRTRIVYEPANKEKAEFVAAALPKARLEEGKTRRGVDVAVIVGEAFAPSPIIQLTPIDIPEPGATPEECR